MKQLSVLLVHRESDNYRKLTGWFSYPVPEFVWTAYKVGQSFNIKPSVDGHDLIVMDDWIFGKIDKGGRNLAYVTVDSARSDEQLKRNLDQAQVADLLLVDSDRLEKFYPAGKPVRRFAYAVNEKLFYPHEHIYDVAFLCWPTPDRRKVQHKLAEICNRQGWSFLTGTYNDPLQYAEALCTAKVVVHWQHVAQARSWRVFDVMAAHSCLLTNKIPLISGDEIYPGVHYEEYDNLDDLEPKLSNLMAGQWRDYAVAGYEHVIENHTWATRAKQLRMILAEVLGL